jgi:hypothetical protein
LYPSFPFSQICYAPLHADLTVNKDGIYYLGHIEAVYRERKENEFHAGRAMNLDGTFDITISDNCDIDIQMFKNKFVQLKDIDIQKAILPPFDRNKADQFWETHKPKWFY